MATNGWSTVAKPSFARTVAKQAPATGVVRRTRMIPQCTNSASSPVSVSRRATLLALPTGLSLLAAPQQKAVAKEIVSDGIFGERFQQCPATFVVPDDWKTRPGQKPKMEKYILYTDTYGPVFRYTRTFPRLLDAEGATVADRIQVQASPAKDAVDITDLGRLESIDAPNAFGVEAKNDDLRLADVAVMSQRTDAAGVTYFEWQLDLPSGGVMLLSATVTGGGLYVLSLDTTAEQWARSKEGLTGALSSFAVAPAEESTTDVSNRIYNNAPSLMK